MPPNSTPTARHRAVSIGMGLNRISFDIGSFFDCSSTTKTGRLSILAADLEIFWAFSEALAIVDISGDTI